MIDEQRELIRRSLRRLVLCLLSASVRVIVDVPDDQRHPMILFGRVAEAGESGFVLRLRQSTPAQTPDALDVEILFDDLVDIRPASADWLRRQLG